ncbi:MAG: hypothetical protein HY978_03570 [Candidatus Liptonbacteria bacterium]|nr:hypothetical protein [Candidatus Liptonbacteria bacterium]
MKDPIFPIGPEITEDDEYDENPERRKLFWLDNARKKYDAVLTDLHRKLDELPVRYQELLQKGQSNIELAHRFLDRVPRAYVGRMQSLLDEIEGITDEKGFLFDGAMSTPREHQQVGSSGYGGIYWETDPDVPVPILRVKLREKGIENMEDGQTYTIERMDRARRLAGLTALDLETGRATGNVDTEATKDPYHFLTAQRREEVRAREDEILNELKTIWIAIVDDCERAAVILNDLALYTDGGLTSAELEKRYQELILDKGVSIGLDKNIKVLKQLSFETGKRDRILTPQEILLRTGATVNNKYMERPYTPLAVQDGVPVEEINKLRQAEGSMVVNSEILGYEMPCGFKLESLDDERNTPKDPTLIDRFSGAGLDIRKLESELGRKINMPLARSGE